MSENIIFKQVKEDQYGEIFKLAEIIWRNHYPDIISKEQIEYMLENFCSVNKMIEQTNEHYLFYLVEENHRNIGYFAIKPEPDNNKLFISKVYLLQSFQGKGVGQKILDYIVNFAKKNQLNILYLTVNKENINAIKAYKKKGFVVVDDVITDIGGGYVMDDHIMELRVKS